MKRTKTLFGIFLLLSFILSLFSINTFILNVKALPDKNFIFDDNLIVESDINTFSDIYNLRNVSEYTDIYNGSYSFTNEIEGTNSTNISFIDIDNSGADTIILINDTLDNHNNVINFDDNSVINAASGQNLYTSQVSGTIELWMRSTDVTHLGRILGYDGANVKWQFGFFNEFIYYFDGVVNNIIGALDNTWYHFRMDFECGAGAYEGLAPDTYFLYINSEKYGAFPYHIAAVSTERTEFLTDAGNILELYVDGIGYSWLTNYTIFDNVIPFLNETEGIKEVDRYEFALSDVDTFNPVGLDNPNGWSDVEIGGGDKVNIANEIDGSFDKLVLADSSVINDKRGIEIDNLGIDGNLFNITAGFIPEIMDGVLNSWQILIRSTDSSLVTSVIFDSGFNIYIDGPLGLTTLASSFSLNNRYEINILLHYDMNRIFLILIENNIVIELISEEMNIPDKTGLRKIRVVNNNVDNNQIRTLTDFVGIYRDGRPKVIQDFGVTDIDIFDNFGINIWNVKNNNLITLKANGTFHLGAATRNYSDGGSPLIILKDTDTYTDISKIINVFDAGPPTSITAPEIVLTVFSQTLFNVSFLKISGVVLNESTNSYNLLYEGSGVETDESFFFVENNILKFNHIANDTNVEFIQARFNINDVSSDGFSLSFLSQIENNALGFMRVNFTSISNIVQFPLTQKTTRFILTQNLTIRDLIVLVSDRDLDSITGLTTGSISQISLLETSNISVSIITTSLIALIIPLILIIIPTLAISTKIGKSFIIPLFLLFSVIAVSTNLIPIWLFFVIGFASLLFLTKKESKELV